LSTDSGFSEGSSSSYSGGSNGNRKNQKLEYACYGRVESPCVLNYHNIDRVVSLDKTTTTEVPTTTTAAALNGASTSSSSAAFVPTDLSKIPQCVRNAVCVPRTKHSISTGSHIYKTNDDPRIGMCACASGYESTQTDRCAALKSTASNTFAYGLSIALFAFVSKMII
jgi:hypothetical protein